MSRRPTFTIAAYVRSHHSTPRGRGLWCFQYSSTREAFTENLFGDVRSYSGTLTEAQRAFVADNPISLSDFVAVLP